MDVYYVCFSMYVRGMARRGWSRLKPSRGCQGTRGRPPPASQEVQDLETRKGRETGQLPTSDHIQMLVFGPLDAVKPVVSKEMPRAVQTLCCAMQLQPYRNPERESGKVRENQRSNAVGFQAHRYGAFASPASRPTCSL